MQNSGECLVFDVRVLMKPEDAVADDDKRLRRRQRIEFGGEARNGDAGDDAVIT
jgi:hypothetical protein